MPTPQGVNTVTLQGRYVEPDLFGTPLVGSVVFTPNVAMVTFPNEDTMMSGTEIATLDSNGEFTIDLPCTDTPDQNPDGWAYTVTEKLIGVRGRTYNIFLPFTLAVIDLADITPTDAAPAYLPVVGPQGPPGLVTSVNGISLPNIVLTASDVGAIATSAAGAAGGVATLDGSSKVPLAQIPNLGGTYVLSSLVGAANGVASLDSGTKVPSTQLDLADAAPGAIATSGAVGVGTQLAREDHTHAGMALTGAQSAAGNKTFTNDVYVNGGKFGLGIASSLGGRGHVKSTVDEITLLLEQTVTGGTNPVLGFLGSEAVNILLAGKVAADSQYRIAVKASGNLELGSGGGARDVTLYRSAAGILNSTGQFASDSATPSAASHLTRKDYVDGLDAANVKLTGTQTVAGAKTFSGAGIFSSTLTVTSTATMNGQTVVNDLVKSTRAAASDSAYESRVTSDANARWFSQSDGKNWWGPGNAAVDTNLYRSAADTLKTDDNFVVGGNLTITGDIINTRQPKMQRAQESFVFSASSSVDVNVTFSPAFSAVPRVAVTMSSTTTLPAGSSALIVKAFNVTTTGMTLRMLDINAVNRTLTMPADWIAVDQ